MTRARFLLGIIAGLLSPAFANADVVGPAEMFDSAGGVLFVLIVPTAFIAGVAFVAWVVLQSIRNKGPPSESVTRKTTTSNSDERTQQWFRKIR